MTWNVMFFQTNRGTYPVKDFITKQDANTYAKILHSIQLLRNNGPFLKLPYIKKLRNNIFELRISGKQAIRIFYSFSNNQYHLLHAFKKKSQKTPSKELKTALDRSKEII